MRRVVIMGAAGRDFHNFNTVYRNNKQYKVIAFTAAQIPDIAGRKYPRILAGRGYPKGIPIYPEEKLEWIVKKFKVDQVDFAYSDVAHENLMHLASRVLATGADFQLVGGKHMMIASKKPLVSVCAVRTGCGKSPTSFFIASELKKMGKRVGVIRHPMPYGDLAKEAVQEFATYDDMKKHRCTIEEMEEYERYVVNGMTIFAGVDYEKILRLAEKKSDVILWDGGNNDVPFYRSDLHVVVADPHRAGHELAYYPGEVNTRTANVVIISKVKTAKKKNIELVKRNVKQVNPKANILQAAMKLSLSEKMSLRNKRVLIVEDGPTLTHGEMKYGAGWEVATRHKAKIVDPRPFARGTIKKTFEKYTHLSEILPAMGYGKKQMKELEQTINRVKCDVVVIATPIDLGKLLKINKPAVRVKYEFAQVTGPSLMSFVRRVV